MTVQIQCVCGRTLLAPDRRIGTKVACPDCGLRVLVPDSTSTERASAGAALDSLQAPPVLVSADRSFGAMPSSLTRIRPIVGAEAAEDLRETVAWLGAALGILAMIALVPASMEFFDFLNQDQALRMPRWVYLVAVASLIQFAYAIYLVQIPDWGSLWSATIALLFLAASYALLTGLTLFASAANSLVQYFELGPVLEGRRAAGWCLAMLSLAGILTYVCGRVAARSRAAATR